MSRVHDALRKAEQSALLTGEQAGPGPQGGKLAAAPLPLDGLLEKVDEIDFNPLADSLLLAPGGDHADEGPVEEFRALRTRLNHLQTLQPIHSVVVTSPSPAEGKSFTAANLAISEAGITDYLQGKAELAEIIKKVSGLELCIMPAGEPVMNPLELLNLAEARRLLEQLPRLFNWVILDTPPLLFAADANLLSTLCHGTLLVVRIGATTIDSVTRAMQSLCENNVLGIVANGARRGELYSKYTYYHSYYYKSEEEEEEEDEDA